MPPLTRAVAPLLLLALACADKSAAEDCADSPCDSASARDSGGAEETGLSGEGEGGGDSDSAGAEGGPTDSVATDSGGADGGDGGSSDGASADSGGDSAAPEDSGSTGPVDLDADGADSTTDCDDADASVHPGASEVCGDGVDSDCDLIDPPCPGLLGTTTPSLAHIVIEAPSRLNDTVGIGDLTGDGRGDLAVAEYWGGGASNGVVHVFDDLRAGERRDPTTAVTSLTGNPGTGLAGGLEHSADLTGDGLLDLVMVEQTGSMSIWEGPLAPGALTLSSAWCRLEFVTAWAVTGQLIETVPDPAGGAMLLVADELYPEVGEARGLVRIYHPGDLAAGATWVEHSGTLTGPAQSMVGAALRSAGDMDGDGVAELLVTALTYGGTPAAGPGAVAVYSADELSGTLNFADFSRGVQSDQPSLHIGHDIDSADMDGDGYDEVLATLWDIRGDAMVSVYPGPLRSILDESDHVQHFPLSSSVASGSLQISVGDLNSDGLPDLAAGQSGDSTAGTYYGAARIWYGPGLSSPGAPDAIIYGEAGYTGVGGVVEIAPDLSGDALPDLVVGPEWEDWMGVWQGD